MSTHEEKKHELAKAREQARLRRELSQFVNAFGSEHGAKLFEQNIPLKQALANELMRLRKLAGGVR